MPAVYEGNSPGDDVPGGRQHGGGAVAEGRQQNIASERDPQHRPAGVDSVEGSDVPSRAGTVPHESLAEHGQCRPHKRGRHDEQREDQQEFHEQETLVAQAEGVREPHPERRRMVERYREQGAADADADLEPPIDGDEVPEPRHPARGQQGAQSKSGHERRQDGRRRVHGVAEHKAQKAEPHHLIDEPGGSRKKEAEHDDPGPGGDHVAVIPHATTIA